MLQAVAITFEHSPKRKQYKAKSKLEIKQPLKSESNYKTHDFFFEKFFGSFRTMVFF